jgi:hypothetical protein
VFVGELSAWLTACPEKKKREKTAYATQVRAAAAVDASSAFRAASRSQGTCGGEHVHFICRYMIDLCLHVLLPEKVRLDPMNHESEGSLGIFPSCLVAVCRLPTVTIPSTCPSSNPPTRRSRSTSQTNRNLTQPASKSAGSCISGLIGTRMGSSSSNL